MQCFWTFTNTWMGKKMQNLCSVHSFSWGSHSSLVVSLLSCDRRMLCKSCSGLENMIRIRLWCFDWRTDFQLQLFNGFNSCYNYNHFLNLFSLWNTVQLVLQNLDESEQIVWPCTRHNSSCLWAMSHFSLSLSPYFPPPIILVRVDPKICFSDLWWLF